MHSNYKYVNKKNVKMQKSFPNKNDGNGNGMNKWDDLHRLSLTFKIAD